MPGTPDPARPPAERHARAAALLPAVRGLVSTDRHQVGHYIDAPAVPDSWPGRSSPLAELGTSCPDHFLRTKVKPLVDLPGTAPVEDVWRGSSPARTTSPTAPPRPTRPTWSGCSPPSLLDPRIRTWSLVSVELDAPVLSAASRAANFPDELGIDGTVRYLRNVMGLWLLQEYLRSWASPDLDAPLGAVDGDLRAVATGRR